MAAAHIDDDIIEELLRKYQSKFISVVDAHAIVDELCQEKIIDEDLAERVRKETTKDAASSMVYQHLVRQADGGHLDRVCTLMMAKESFPRMRRWAEKMRSELCILMEGGQPVVELQSMMPRAQVPSQPPVPTGTTSAKTGANWSFPKPSQIDLQRITKSKAIGSWQSLITFLGVPYDKMTLAKRNNPGHMEAAFLEALMVWYSGDTSTPVTWGPLLSAIEDSGQREYGRELRAELALLGYVSDSQKPVAMETTDDQLKLADVHHSVTPLVASKWYTFGLHLGMESYVLEIIEGSRMKPEECTREMFRRWLNSESGTGSTTRSKKSVLEAVDLTFGDLMRGMVKDALN